MKYDNHYKEQTEKLLQAVYRDIEKQNISEYKTVHPRRTTHQNSYLRVIQRYFACEYGCSEQEVDVDFYKRKCNSDIYEIEKVNKRGQKIKTLRSSTELTTAEMSLSIDRFRNWSAMEAGIYLPSPEEHQFLMYCENEIERNKEFI